MRHIVQNYTPTEPLPKCEHCGEATQFSKAAFIAKDNRVHLVFKCLSCGQEMRVARPEWQHLADMLVTDE
jgi:RNase P subunit RPR2